MTEKSVQAYMNHGRWVAECVRPYCGNAMKLQPLQRQFHCGGNGGCGLIATVAWPADVEGITQALEKRPVPATRNWMPSGHQLAVRSGIPHGQSARELEEETLHYLMPEEG